MSSSFDRTTYIKQHISNIYPLSICGTYRITLNEHDKETKNRKLLRLPNYKDIFLMKEIRTREDKQSNCYR